MCSSLPKAELTVPYRAWTSQADGIYVQALETMVLITAGLDTLSDVAAYADLCVSIYEIE